VLTQFGDPKDQIGGQLVEHRTPKEPYLQLTDNHNCVFLLHVNELRFLCGSTHPGARGASHHPHPHLASACSREPKSLTPPPRSKPRVRVLAVDVVCGAQRNADGLPPPRDLGVRRRTVMLLGANEGGRAQRGQWRCSAKNGGTARQRTMALLGASGRRGARRGRRRLQRGRRGSAEGRPFGSPPNCFISGSLPPNCFISGSPVGGVFSIFLTHFKFELPTIPH
jgi:hypothetical protein